MPSTRPKTKPSPKASNAAAKGRERRIPRLREQCQKGFDTLCVLLNRAGHGAILEPIKDIKDVDEVLRKHPEVVPTMLTAAWELRGEKQFAELFRHAETGELVSERDQPIAPCGRTYNEVVQAHLYGAARLYLEHLERRWARSRARQAEAEYHEEQKEKRSTLTGRLFGSIKELTSDAPNFTTDQYRPDYPGYGIYERIKPLLTSVDHFKLIPLYGKLQTRQVDALGDLLLYFTDRRDLEALTRLSAEDIAQAKGFSRIFAEAKLGVSMNPGRMATAKAKTKSADPEQEAADAAKRAQLPKEERRMFDLLLTRYLDCLPALKSAGVGAETTLRRLTPVFGDDVFALFRSEQELSNAINCPEFILKIIGISARRLSQPVAQSLGQIQNKDITRDLLGLALETFPREDFEFHISDDSRRQIWTSLPAKFNNKYSYQADAPDGSTNLRNYENLTTVCEGIFECLRTGRVDKLN
jgi:hypothetical protein